MPALNKAKLEELTAVRIAEAGALLTLSVPMPDAAYYLAGYAVECGLKACIAKDYTAGDWPDKDFVNQCYTHKLLTLVQLAKLEGPMLADIAANPTRGANWQLVKDWSERSRYERHTQA